MDDLAPPTTKLLTIHDAALATGLTPKALRRRIERGTLRSVFANERRLIAMDELLRQGLLVPLEGTPAPPPRHGGIAETRVGTRLDRLEEQLAAQRRELAELRARLEALERR